ncbi:UNVERIFIED_CONTAM: hypothetical protein FKN15_052146 [Acipenser sinensis]
MYKYIRRYSECMEKVRKGGGDNAVLRHTQRNKKLLVWDRLRQLLDGEDFLELSPFAGLGMPYGDVPSAGCVTGKISGLWCVFIANDATVKGGTAYPITVKKQLRAQDVAIQNHLPCVYLVDSGGGFLPLQEQEAYECARNIITTLNFELPLEDLSEEQDPLYSSSELHGLAPRDYTHTLDIKLIVSRLTDGSRFQEFKALYGTTLVTGFAKIEGHLVGVVANNGELTYEAALKGSHFVQLCDQRGIPLIFLQNTPPYSAVTETLSQAEINTNRLKAQASMMSAVACASTPKITVVIGGCYGGESYAMAEINTNRLKAQASMMSAVACASTPKITVVIGGCYGGESYAMCGRSFDPNFLFLWPNARVAAVGPEHSEELSQWAEPLKEKNQMKKRLEEESSAFYSSGRVWDDGVILPKDTRKVSCIMSLSNYLRVHYKLVLIQSYKIIHISQPAVIQMNLQ